MRWIILILLWADIISHCWLDGYFKHRLLQGRIAWIITTWEQYQSQESYYWKQQHALECECRISRQRELSSDKKLERSCSRYWRQRKLKLGSCPRQNRGSFYPNSGEKKSWKLPIHQVLRKRNLWGCCPCLG